MTDLKADVRGRIVAFQEHHGFSPFNLTVSLEEAKAFEGDPRDDSRGAIFDRLYQVWLVEETSD